MLAKLEELVGEIRNPFVRAELETVLSRLVLCGIQPDEAVLLVECVFSNTLEELYYAEYRDEENGL